MSTFPQTMIYLCNVPFDASQKHQVYFTNTGTQQNYFNGKVRKTLTNYQRVRGESPESVKSIKVEMHIDEVRALPCNYLFYRNDFVSNRYDYCFITGLKYVNEECTEIFYKVDVFQTYMTDFEILPSFVEREHPVTDRIGENLVPESFKFDDFEYVDVFDNGEWGNLDDDRNVLTSWGYLIGCTEPWGDASARGNIITGVYQGVYFYYFTSSNDINDFISEVEEQAGECILFITCIPEFLVDGNVSNNLVRGSHITALHTLDFNFEPDVISENWITPANNKLYTFPYVALSVTNHNEKEKVYAVENFHKNEVYSDGIRHIYFNMEGDISATPSIMAYPLEYNGKSENIDECIMLGEFPQCSFNNDTFKIWQARNKYTEQLAYASAGVGAVASLLTLDGHGIVQAAESVANTINARYQAGLQPNSGHVGSTSNNLLTAMQKNKFDFYWRKVRSEFAKTVDDYFTMYGYQVNRVKVPNLDSRPLFNYIKTIGVNIVGKDVSLTEIRAIPTDILTELKQIFDTGVTLWRPDAQMYNYDGIGNKPE